MVSHPVPLDGEIKDETASMPSTVPDKEEDEGYLAGQNGQRAAANPYPRGTIRYLSWRRGWQLASQRLDEEETEGYRAAALGLLAKDNPHPEGTIRFQGWRRGWEHHRETARRALRLSRETGPVASLDDP